MFRDWKLAPDMVTQKLAALLFFYVQVLKRGGASPRDGELYLL